MKTKRLPLNLVILTLVPAIVLSAMLFTKSNYRILETSILSILKTYAEENAPEPADLGIEKVAIKKIANPTDDFRYYKYKATIIIKNDGGNLIDGRLLLHLGDDQKHVAIRNTDKGFTLLRDQSYIVRNFEFVFDGYYNGGELPLSIELVDAVDYYEKNDKYVIEIFDSEAKLKDLKIEEILRDKTKKLDYYSIPYSIKPHIFEVMTSDDFSVSDADQKYVEFENRGKLIAYNVIDNSLDTEDFDSEEVTELEAKFVEGTDEYFYIKATNPETGYYAVSDLIRVPSQDKLSRGEFADKLIEIADVRNFDDGMSYYTDVDRGDDHFSSIQTLYNLGLLSTGSFQFHSDSTATRGDALRIVLDMYDVDLEIGRSPTFSDVAENHYLYPYIESLSSKEVFGEKFHPDDPVTLQYLKYLIYEYK